MEISRNWIRRKDFSREVTELAQCLFAFNITSLVVNTTDWVPGTG